MTFTVEIIKALAWPVLVASFLIYLLVSSKASTQIAGLLKPFRSLKVFGTEFVLNEETGKKAEEAFAEYRKQAKSEFDRKIEVYALRDKLENTVQGEILPALRQNIPDLRCTVHVPDILFAETLYQLLDYYPQGGGRGRTRSARFGIIGVAWRSGDSRIEGKVPTDPSTLIREWGMTREEATAAGKGKRSFTCVILRDEESTPVGLLYMDSGQEDAFGNDDPARTQLLKTIAEGSKKRGLTNALLKLNQELRARSPLIRIHEDR